MPSIPTDSLTDLIGGLLLLPMIGILYHRKTEKVTEKRYWVRFLSLLAVSCLLGFVAHYWCTAEWSFRLIWVPLYTAMYETVNVFFLLAWHLYTGGERPTGRDIRLVHVLSAMAWLPTVLLELINTHWFNPIRIFVFFALVEALWGFWYVLRSALESGGRTARLLLCALIPLLPGVYFQIERKTVWHLIWKFNYNAITHICIIISMFILFAVAMVSLSPIRSGHME